MNNLYNQLNRGISSQNNNLKQMIDMFKSSNNPQMLLQNMLRSNPRVQQLIQQCDGDPKTAFYNLARQRGINPDDILNMFK